jgi:hypothetical protein
MAKQVHSRRQAVQNALKRKGFVERTARKGSVKIVLTA